MLRGFLALASCCSVVVGCGGGGGPVTGGAASCGSQTPAQARARAELVVEAVAQAGRADPQGVLISPARFRALRYLKGHGPAVLEVQTAVTVSHAGGFDHGGEGIEPHAGERWLIYGGRMAQATIGTGVCAGSHVLRANELCPRQKAQRLPADALADDDAARGGYAGRNCGRRLQHRTVVVYLSLPAMGRGASLSEGVVLVSRFHGRYRIWARLH